MQQYTSAPYTNIYWVFALWKENSGLEYTRVCRFIPGGSLNLGKRGFSRFFPCKLECSDFLKTLNSTSVHTYKIIGQNVFLLHTSTARILCFIWQSVSCPLGITSEPWMLQTLTLLYDKMVFVLFFQKKKQGFRFDSFQIVYSHRGHFCIPCRHFFPMGCRLSGYKKPLKLQSDP